MNRNVILCLLFGWLSCFTFVPNTTGFAAASATAKPITPKDAHKALLTVFTYDADGKLLATGTGFFINDKGDGAAAFHLFKGASRAEVVDWKGNRLPVLRILGAVENYDLVTFTTPGAKKLFSMTIAGCVSVDTATTLSLIRPTTEKKPLPQSVRVTTVEDFDEYKYLSINAANDSANFACPLLNAEGGVVAITQQNVTPEAATLNAIDARFLQKMTVNSTAAFNADLQAIRIPKALPADAEDALTFVYMMSYKDSLQAITACNDFLQAYPDHTEAYVCRGSLLARKQQYAAAEADFTTAMEKAKLPGSGWRSDEVHGALSKLIYQQVTGAASGLPESWTLQRAYDEAVAAESEHSSPHYRLQQANCLFAMKEYARAYQGFHALGQDPTLQGEEWSARTRSELWFSAVRAWELSGGDSLQAVVLMDSVVAQLEKPYSAEDARFLLERAARLQRAGEYRRAIADYNEYERVVGVRQLNDRFYFVREQLELESKMYQQALDDIQTAMALNPANPEYPVEQVYIMLRAGLYEDVINACNQYLKTAPDNPDYYKFRGIAEGELGQKAKARQSLQKAKELGDPTIDALLQRYQ